jgi:hypothetical protein
LEAISEEGKKMGLGRFLLNVVDRKFPGKDIVRKQIEAYYQQRSTYPDQAQHIHLAQVWLSRQEAQGINISSTEMQSLSYTETLACACIPHPQCAEALGYFILYSERPDIATGYPEFSASFHQLMKPVWESQKRGTLEKLYRKYNPNMKEEYMDILFGR